MQDARATAESAPGPIQLLATVPHRFFFLSGVTALAVDALWWTWTLVARTGWPAPPVSVSPTALHAFVMLFGFAPLFMFGFLFTAGPRWLGIGPPPPGAWRPAGIAAALASIAIVPLQALPPIATQIAAGVYALAWAALLAQFVRLIRRSIVPDKVHTRLIAVAFAAGIAGVASFALAGAAAHAFVKLAGLWFFLLPVFVVVCHRMIPFFTANVVPFVTAFRPWWLLAAMAAAPAAHGVIEALGLGAWTLVVDLPAAVLLFGVTARWGIARSLSNRLLAMLHLGFVWYGIGFALYTVAAIMVLAGGASLGFAPMHALTMGFASSLVLAMVTRVSCGHTGRPLVADGTTWALFLLLQVATVARIASEFLPGGIALAIAAVLFALSVVPWSFKYAPLYWRAREDGAPG